MKVCRAAPDVKFFSAEQALCGHAAKRAFAHAFEQMRLDNTASIACGTFVQNHTQMHHSPTHPYRRLSGINVIKISAAITKSQYASVSSAQSSVTLHPNKV